MTVQSMERLDTSTENVYLVVSDLHKSYKNKSNRLDYSREIKYVEEKIVELAVKYREQGSNVYLLFLGDVFDNSYRSVGSALESSSEMNRLTRFFNKVYSVVGNHELTYYSNNPFWYLMKTIDSNRVKMCGNGKWKAKGNVQLINVCDTLVDGNVEFLFNHYGCNVYPASPDKYSIGLFHQDIVFRGVLDDAKRNNRQLFELSEEEMKTKFKHVYLEDSDVLYNYNYCFFGHMHLLYGKWVDDEKNLTLEYLASQGRTNHKEVNNDFLERNIPAVIVKNGDLVRIEDNKFNLMSREECVNEEHVLIQNQKYKRSKERRAVKDYDSLCDDPILSIKSFFNNVAIDAIIDNILNDDVDMICLDAEKRLKD